MTLTFLDPERAKGPAPDLGALRLPARAIHISRWGDRGPGQGGYFGGVWAEPAHRVLGLRVWDDAREGVGPGGEPRAFFEVEKIARMLLHGSPLAIEILAAPALAGARPSAFDPRRALLAGATSASLHSCAGALHAGGLRGADGARRLLSCALLARRGELSLALDTLRAAWPEPAEAAALIEGALAAPGRAINELKAARSIGAWLESDAKLLGPRPADYDALSRMVTAARREAEEFR